MSGAGTPVLFVALTFALAGLVKGVAGMGLPTVAMGLLGLTMAPAEAAGLLIAPSLITNVWQFAAGRHRWMLFRRTWPLLAAIVLATWAASGMLTAGSSSRATAALGAALALYASLGLARLRLSVPRRTERWLGPLIGATTGVITGATGVFVIPAVPYLQALDLDRDDLVQVLGLSFTASTIALAAGLATRGAFQVAGSGASLLCAVPALGGMWLGQALRERVNAATFRTLFFLGQLLLGLDLLGKGLL